MKSMPVKVVLIIIALCNVIGFGILFITKSTIFQNVTFSANLSNLGSSLVTYSTAMMALLIAMVVVLFGADDSKLNNFKKSGYLHATYLLYMVTFFELGLTMAFSLLCMSNIQSVKVASYSLTFALITFLLICLLGFQLLRLKKIN
ncbi:MULTISPECIES: hypothetical protein [Proteus]|uniref:hypothetical protein n=1 Tax=Proteus TaxID=583 RepID=UPI0034D5886A